MLAVRIAVALAIAVSAHAGRLPVRVYRTSDGLPRNSVICMAPGANGAMWFCTTEGLVRFDGLTFRVFGRDQGLPSQTVMGFQPARAGGYWVITDRGVCRLPAGARIGDPCKVLSNTPSGEWNLGGMVLEAADGEVWLASTKHVYSLRQSDGALLDAGFPLWFADSILKIAEGEQGSLLVCTEGGLFERSPSGEVRVLTAKLGKVGISDLIKVSATDTWLATSQGLFRMRRTRANHGTPEFRGGWIAYPDYPRHLMRRRDGTIWANSTESVLQLAFDPAGDMSVARRIGRDDGLPAVVLEDMAEDAAGVMWVATEGAGVARIDDRGFSLYDTSEGLHTARMAAIFEDRSGSVCAMTSWDGQHDLHVLRNRQFVGVPIPYPREIHSHSEWWNEIALQARDGDWWVATRQGVLRFAAATVDNLPHAPLKRWYRTGAGLTGDDVSIVFEDSAGAIWIAAGKPEPHVERLKPGDTRFRAIMAADGWPAGESPTIFKEPEPGTLWIGTFSGVFRYRDGHFDHVSRHWPPGKPWVRDMIVDREGRVWVATGGEGLFRCDHPDAADPVFVNYSTAQGLASAYLRAITQDRDGYIYVGSVRGVDRIDPRAPMDAERVLHFTAADGLPDNEHNVAMTGRDGHLWFGTLRGVAEFDPARVPRRAAPGVYFTRLLVRGEEAPLAWDGAAHASLALSPDRNQIQIEFAGSDARAAALRYEYRLVGHDRQWSEPVNLQRVNYPVLPAGRLRFEVRAVNAEGQYSSTPAVLDLDVAAPLWKRGWFLLLLAASLTAMGAAAYRYRIEQLLKLERLRMRIATDLHDDIGSNLSQIALLSEMARQDPARGPLELVSSIARETVEQMSDIVWAVNPRHDSFEALLHRMRRYASDTLGGAGIELKFLAGHLPADLTTPIELRRPLYLVFKEAVNNAARHSHAGQVTVRLEVQHGRLHMSIEDDGRGFDLSAPREGEGVTNIGRRMREVGGSAEWNTAPGKGTRLFVLLPLRHPRHYLN
ncbi:MAG TPA: ATP-binding protein [Candidatus Limnocylindrales bacterium]|nr:ATP-binding protein [Candidatus Limnocylindrales bacterium]